MKRILFVCMMMAIAVSAAAMSRSKVRNHARFLTDRMAYELDLTPMQYDDCYEVNYDFIYHVAPYMDDVVYGYHDAIEHYYTYLDYRNDDMRYILSAFQYARFMASEYFYSPIYSTGRDWAFRIYTIYSNRSFFYFDAPSIFKTYRGGHDRLHFGTGFYNNRYAKIPHHTGSVRIQGSQNYDGRRKADFGTNLKPRTGTTYNNYSNPNSPNRTTDRRYQDNSGNHNSPAINNRTRQSGAATTQPAQATPRTSAPTGSRGSRTSNPASSASRSQRSASTGSSSSTSSSTRGSGTVRSGRR